MDHLMSNDKIAKAIKAGDAFDFQCALKEKLKSTAQRKIGLVVEETDSDAIENPFISISSAARSFGGYDADEESGGVIAIYFRSKQAVQDFADYLETSNFVDYYEINASWGDRTKDRTQEVVDLDSISDDRAYTFQIIIYLYPEYALVYGDNDSEDDDTVGYDDAAYENVDVVPGEPIHEVMRKIRINAKNVRSIKMKCGRGFKWDPSISACVKIGGADLADLRVRARHAVRTKKAEGAAFATRVKRRTLKAFKFRKMAGLEI